jgi:hypothetical protein
VAVTLHQKQEAFRLAQKLAIVEIELSAMTAQCLGTRRIGDIKTLNVELSAWHSQRNRKQKGVDWQFTATDTRTKLKRLYPEIIE